MIGAAACLLAFVLCLLGARRSAGIGLAALIPVGFIYGYFRIVVFDGFSHFLFDAALIGFYVGHFGRSVSDEDQRASNAAMQWTVALVGWPIICIMYSPLVDSQPLLVQFVGLRADALMIPLLVVGARLRRSDLELLAPVVAVCCIAALGFGVLQFVRGVDAFIPRNPASVAIYTANDSVGYVRIPSMFSNAHAFGGAMAGSIPIMLLMLESPSSTKRILGTLAITAAVAAVFLSSTRTSVIILALVGLVIAVSGGRRMSIMVFMVGLVFVASVALQDETRLQRFTTLSDTDMVSARVAQSVNAGFFSLLAEYPFGAGLAHAWGTSIPYFLSDGALPPIGLENEFGRLLVEEGIFGVVGWAALAISAIARFGRKANDAFTFLSGRAAYACVIGAWATAFIGAGLLYGIPNAPLLLLYMGTLVRAEPTAVPVVTGSAFARKAATARVSEVR